MMIEEEEEATELPKGEENGMNKEEMEKKKPMERRSKGEKVKGR